MNRIKEGKERIGEPILGNSARLLLNRLTATLSPGEGQRHNLTVDSDGEMTITLMMGDYYWPCKFSDEDLLKPVDKLADEITEMIKARYYDYENN